MYVICLAMLGRCFMWVWTLVGRLRRRLRDRQVDGSWWVLDEIVTENCSAYDFGRILKDYISQNYPNSPTEIYCDPAGMQKGQASDDTPILMLEKWGFDVMPAPSNKFEARKGALDSYSWPNDRGRDGDWL